MKETKKCNESCPYLRLIKIDYGLDIPTIGLVCYCQKDTIVPELQKKVRYNDYCTKLSGAELKKEIKLRWLENMLKKIRRRKI